MVKKISELSIDPKLTELRPVNPAVVGKYRQAMRSGAVFPKPIIDKSGRVISGNHRVTAWGSEYGPDHEIEVTVEKFQDEAAVIRRFAEENSKHGSPLSGISMKAITQALLKHGDSAEVIAAALNVPVAKVKWLGGMAVAVIGNGKKREMRPIKHGLAHMVGKTVTEEQYAEHMQADRGVQAACLARQLIRWIENGWIDTDDSQTVAVLIQLREALHAFSSGIDTAMDN